MTKTTNNFIYALGFAVINLAEAIVQMACLGMWSPAWVMSYASWHMRRKSRKAG